MSTKEKILSAALKLFNESNTQAATTNHIAAEAGISPGNLHYHYKNREAIILKLYEEMKSKTELGVSELPNCLSDLHLHKAELAKIYWEYRFFHRELLFLLSRDPILKESYIRDNIAHRERIVLVLNKLIDNGYLEIPYDNVIEELADHILMYNQFWNSYLETLGEPLSIENIQKSFHHLDGAMRPYLTPKGYEEIRHIEA